MYKFCFLNLRGARARATNFLCQIHDAVRDDKLDIWKDGFCEELISNVGLIHQRIHGIIVKKYYLT